MLEETGVDVVWIARGAIGNPWIFHHAEILGMTEDSGLRIERESNLNLSPQSSVLSPPSIAEQREALAEHFEIAMEIHGESLAGRRMRKMGIKYSRFHPSAAEVKSEFIAVHSLRDWTNVLEKWDRGNGPGVGPSPTAANEGN